jgi:hypothetical protein
MSPAHEPSRLVSLAGRFPKLVFLVLCPYIVVSAASSYFLENAEGAEAFRPILTTAMFVVFVALAIVFSLWFLSCFSGADKLDSTTTSQMFYFAYTFTITSFVVLLIPIANPWQPDIVGPMSLVRGCVLAPDQNEESVPGAVRCSRSEVRYLAAEDRAPYTSLKNSQEVPPLDCAKAKTGERCVEKETYPWVITLGGFNGVTVGKREANSPSVKSDPVEGGQKSDADTTMATVGIPMDRERVSIIQGGFVVPFYVVLLAFIGGAVSLTRRIPEYQKRAEENYQATTRQPKLSVFEVREVVVFQIMQLMSAPFIAVVAFYALAPASMATAIALAFLSGFASELILLQVRGIIEGLQPHITAFNNPVNVSNPPAPPVAVVKGLVQDINGMPLADVDVHIEGGTSTTRSLTDGSFSLKDVRLGNQSLVLQQGGLNKAIGLTVSAGDNDLGVVSLEQPREDGAAP